MPENSSPLRSLYQLILAALVLLIGFGCGGPGPASDTAGGFSEGLPPLTDKTINERINGSWGKVEPAEGQPGEPITWRFFRDEPKDLRIIEKSVDGSKATVVLEIKTTSSSRSREPKYLEGQIRTHWEIESGFVLRKWGIVKTENISMKYRNLPKKPASDSDE